MARSTESLLEQKIADLEALIETLQRAPIQVIIDHLEVKHTAELKKLQSEKYNLSLENEQQTSYINKLKEQIQTLGHDPINYYL
jgi:hypothetical protein